VHARHFIAKELSIEERLGALKALRADGDGLPIWLLGLLLQRRVGRRVCHLLFMVLSNIAQLLLDVAHNLDLS